MHLIGLTVLVGLSFVIVAQFIFYSKKVDELRVLSQFPEGNPGPVLSFDGKGKLVWLNPAAADLFQGVVIDELRELLPELKDADIRRMTQGRETITKKYELKDKYYLLYIVGFPKYGAINVYGTDISIQEEAHLYLQKFNENLDRLVQEKSQNLKKASEVDSLTGANNRFRLEKDLDKLKEPAALVLINIDSFSKVNGAFGFKVGNVVLKELHGVFHALEDRLTFLYRISGDEFAFLHMGGRESIQVLSDNIFESVKHSLIHFKDIPIPISVSQGISFGDSKNHMERASMALWAAKSKGPGIVTYYKDSHSQEEKYQHNLSWSLKLKQALAEDRVIPYFQGIRNNQTGVIEKYETLARIEIDKQIFAPVNFLTVARQSGMLHSVTRKMIDRAFSYFKGTDIEFTINFSSQEFKEGSFIYYLKRKLKENGLSSSQVIIEILESVSFFDSDEMMEKMRELKKIGFKIAVDDFGSEYSNFSRILDLNIDYIKIDGSFIKRLDHDENAYRVTKAIKHLADQINAKTVAEYVRSEDIQKIVEELGIHYSQGYYFAHPDPDPLKKLVS